MIRVKVPATTANIGPGFDAIGIALNLYNYVDIEKRSDHQQNIQFTSDFTIEDSQNLTLTALIYTLERYSAVTRGFDLIIHENNIPLSRGLGSSAAAIVAGIYCANYLLDNRLSQQEIINMATELEGHPDNVVPAILGNMVISVFQNKQVTYSVVEIDADLIFKVLIPSFELSTSKARAAMPKEYPLCDCVNNISKVSLLVSALYSKNYALLEVALQDHIHEPYRLPLIPDSNKILDQLKAIGLYGSFISGAGPTLIGLTDNANDSFDAQIEAHLNSLSHKWTLRSLTADTQGAQYIPL